MAKAKEITSPLLKVLRVELDAALNKVLTKHGLTHSLGNIRYDSTSFGVKLSVALASGTGEKYSPKRDKAAKYLEMFHDMLGIEKKNINAWFRAMNGEELKLVGWNPRAPKNPLVLEGRRGGKYKGPKSMIVNGTWL